jgi:hypothetical protein
MTLIINHRQSQANYHSRKFMLRKTPTRPAPFWRRTASPKKSWFSSTSPISSRGSSPITITPPTNPATPPPSPQFQSQGFRSITDLRTVYIYDKEYTIEIPENYDIYEGLRLYYPELYNLTLEEETQSRLDYTQDRLTEEDCEAAWDHFDYLEYLYD